MDTTLTVMCRHPAWADIIQSREEELLKLKNAALAASIAEEGQNRERLEFCSFAVARLRKCEQFRLLFT